MSKLLDGSVIDQHVTMSCGGGNSSQTEKEGSEI